MLFNFCEQKYQRQDLVSSETIGKNCVGNHTAFYEVSADKCFGLDLNLGKSYAQSRENYLNINFVSPTNQNINLDVKIICDPT